MRSSDADTIGNVHALRSARSRTHERTAVICSISGSTYRGVPFCRLASSTGALTLRRKARAVTLISDGRRRVTREKRSAHSESVHGVDRGAGSGHVARGPPGMCVSVGWPSTWGSSDMRIGISSDMGTGVPCDARIGLSRTDPRVLKSTSEAPSGRSSREVRAPRRCGEQTVGGGSPRLAPARLARRGGVTGITILTCVRLVFGVFGVAADVRELRGPPPTAVCAASSCCDGRQPGTPASSATGAAEVSRRAAQADSSSLVTRIDDPTESARPPLEPRIIEPRREPTRAKESRPPPRDAPDPDSAEALRSCTSLAGLPLTRMRPASAAGVRAAGGLRRSSSSGRSSLDPKMARTRAEHFFCCSDEQCISTEITTGSGDVTKAVSSMARRTSTNLTREVRACTCVTCGSPSAPSQMSTSMQRQPSRSTRRYMWTDARDVS
mmetsp:Transcript_7917/g.25978  ORF Transcript_7917/g.25978 Transcript_7917/m.25978 type:complete len:439 (+) Transcript_7917:1966-3282(+)